MRGTRLRFPGKSVVAILCAASLLATSLGPVSRAVAADTWQTWPRKKAEPILERKPTADPNAAAGDWETWPRKKAEPGIDQTPAAATNGAAKDRETWPTRTTEPGIEQKPATDPIAAARPGDAAEKKPAKRISYGTIGWIALGVAAVLGIAIAAGGGGDGDGGGGVTNPGHH